MSFASHSLGSIALAAYDEIATDSDIAVYPAWLPQPVREGYSRKPAPPVNRFQMDDGHFYKRRQYITKPSNFNLTWMLTFEQLYLIEGWVYNVLNGGEIPFSLILASEELIVYFKTGELDISKADGGMWRASAQMTTIQSGFVTSNAELANWPSYLPTFETDGYSYKATGANAYGESEKGLTFARKRFKQLNTTYKAKLILTLEQRNLFWQFYEVSLNGGASYFNAPFENGAGRTMTRSRFADEPEETPNGAIFDIALELDTAFAPFATINEILTQ